MRIWTNTAIANKKSKTDRDCEQFLHFYNAKIVNINILLLWRSVSSAIVSSDIFNQHASRSTNTSFIAHFAGMGRSQTKYTEIVKEMHLWAQNERNVNLVSIYQTSKEEERNFYRKRSPIFDSFFFRKVLRRFKMAKAGDFDILDDCSS